MPVRTCHRVFCATVAAFVLAACTSGAEGPKPGPSSGAGTSVTQSTARSSATSKPDPTAGPVTAEPDPTKPVTAEPDPTVKPVPTAKPEPAPARSSRPPASPIAPSEQLPLGDATGPARQVITVVAPTQSDTQATVQAWRLAGKGWQRVGPVVHAWLGSAGMTPHPSEQIPAVPMGSFTLTRAFGRNDNPGTALPYVRTTPADWWISQSGPSYNTMQHCSSKCAFTQGDPNEHLYFEIPYYDYAVVIDANRAPVRPGAGSAFFLHVTVGAPTQGCVSIEQGQLVRIMRWLRPADRPRILIGTA